MPSTIPLPPEGGAAPFKPWRMILALMLIYAYAFIDRTFIALLVEPIRSHLHISDVQMGLVLGFSFAFSFCCSNIFAGFLADRINRRKMLIAGSLIWGSMTIICGLSNSFEMILLARAGTGCAEGILAPTVYSLMRDGVPPKSRALAFSIYGLAPMVGTAFALFFGGMLFGTLEHGTLTHFVVTSGLAAWQITLIIVGLFGLPFSLLLFTFREPPRLTSVAPSGGIFSGFADAGRYMIANSRLYGPLLLFSGTAAMINFSQNAWLPTALGRAFGLSPDRIGPALGLMTISAGTVGLLIAGALMNRASGRGQSLLFYGIAGTVGTATGIALALGAPSLPAAYAFNMFGLLFIGLSFAVGAATLTAITPADKVGRISAIYLISETLCGQTLGPLFVALLSENVLGGPKSLPLALSTMVILYAVIASVAALILRKVIETRRVAALA